MGVEPEDAGKVAKLLGIKVFVDEFISFRDLGNLVRNGQIAVSIHSISMALFQYKDHLSRYGFLW